MASVPASRVRALNRAQVRPSGRYVLYWMVAARRCHDNFALQHARDLAVRLGRPLYVLEALRVGYPHASPRLHRFLLQGMADNQRELSRRGVFHHAYVEERAGQGSGLVEALARDACAIVTDDYPTFFIPRMTRALAERVDVPVFAVDGNGLLPMRATERVFTTARSFRLHLHRTVLEAMPTLSEPDPLAGVTLAPLPEPPRKVLRRWPAASAEQLAAPDAMIARLPLRHAVPAAPIDGGPRAGARRLQAFVDQRLARYGERNQPDAEAESGLSPYLNFGQVGSHAVLRAVLERQPRSLDPLSPSSAGRRQGFWGVDEATEGFLDQLLTWRELGFNMAALRADYAEYGSLPAWARTTLEAHAADPRPHLYTLEQFEHARTHDEVWNAAQRQLLETGTIHNYLRMLWGKKILHWSESPEQAVAIMIELNDRYALDGRDPNSYSGIFWTLGRYDRAWGPERPIFGKVRYMSSDATRRKLRLRGYLQRAADATAQETLPCIS